MQPIPDDILAHHEAVLTTRAVPVSRHAEYRKWLRYYLDFRSTYPLPDSIGTGPCVHRAWLLGGLKRKESIIRGSSRLRKNSIYAQMPLESSLWHRCQNSLRMLKKAVSKAAASEEPEAYPLGYVEDLSDVRTKLADFFSILLDGGIGKTQG